MNLNLPFRNLLAQEANGQISIIQDNKGAPLAIIFNPEIGDEIVEALNKEILYKEIISKMAFLLDDTKKEGWTVDDWPNDRIPSLIKKLEKLAKLKTEEVAKVDVGEGYRLIDVNKDWRKKGDQIKDSCLSQWQDICYKDYGILYINSTATSKRGMYRRPI